ncbi:MAG: dihydroorotase [Lactobacillales bacterium]|jgi:dihydroorotase|nr:dihydroorotase [Lactobacillales bacterium]
MTILIKNAQLIDGSSADILISGGIIKEIGASLSAGADARVIDARGALAFPGLVDLHVHLREPGFEYKETIATGTAAAAHGGYTHVCAMPNLNPVPDNVNSYNAINEIIERDAVIKVTQYAAITHALKSEELVNFKGLNEAGARLFTNDGVGVQTAGTMYRAMKEVAAVDGIMVAHTEDESLLFGGVMNAGPVAEAYDLPGILNSVESSQIARDIMLASDAGCHYHVCHVSTAESVEAIRLGKEMGVNVTAEVAPHHLILSDLDIDEDNGKWKMNPPLRSEVDRVALIEALLDGTIDCVATDHAPHGVDEKNQSMLKAPFGIVGSEQAFALMYSTFVDKGLMSLERLAEVMSYTPSEIFDLPKNVIEVGAAANLALFDIDHAFEIKAEDFLSKGKNTPFVGRTVFGDTILTVSDGKIVYSK